MGMFLSGGFIESLGVVGRGSSQSPGQRDDRYLPVGQ